MLDNPFEPVVKIDAFKSAFDNSELDFPVRTSKLYIDDTLNKDHKAVIRDKYYGHTYDQLQRRVEDWWVVGKDYPVKSHRDFHEPIWEEIVNNFNPEDIEDVEVKVKSSRHGRWGLLDYLFPSINYELTTTNNHSTTITFRLLVWTGLDGRTANNFMLGAIDGYCTNGMVFSSDPNSITKLYKRNTKGFCMKSFVSTLGMASQLFYDKAKEYQLMASKRITWQQTIDFIDKLNMAEYKLNSLKELAGNERLQRGDNLFALHSALTNYSSHNDQLDFENKPMFRTRKTKHDTANENMFKRELEVADIFQGKEWKELLNAEKLVA
jgi:hypothetical protein